MKVSFCFNGLSIINFNPFIIDLEIQDVCVWGGIGLAGCSDHIWLC